jgi:homocysteine S-methyltransferase
VTQVIHNYEQAAKIYNYLRPKGFDVIPCILFPSNNNSKSAEFLKLDWSNYKENFTEYVNQIHTLTDDILITSPNDFKGALDFFSGLNLD